MLFLSVERVDLVHYNVKNQTTQKWHTLSFYMVSCIIYQYYRPSFGVHTPFTSTRYTPIETSDADDSLSFITSPHNSDPEIGGSETTTWRYAAYSQPRLQNTAMLMIKPLS